MRFFSRQNVGRSGALVVTGFLGSLFLFHCGGSAFTGASGGGAGGIGGSALSGGAGGANATAGANAAGTASGGSAGAIPAGGAASGGSAGAAQDGGVGGSAPLAGAGGAVGVGGSGINAAGTGGSAPSTVCPATPPSGACVGGLSCTYGDDIRPTCRTQYNCVAGEWSAKLTGCEPVESCAARDGGVPLVGTQCTEVGEDCTLSQGANLGLVYCRCDQGLIAAVKPKWDCVGPPPSPCPQVEPNAGAACGTNGQMCAYGSCSIPTDSAMGFECDDQVWKQTAGGCPTSG